MKFTEMLDDVVAGKNVKSLVEAAVSGGDRVDDIDSPEQKVRAFEKFMAMAAESEPYIDETWVERIATQLRSGASAAELTKMAKKNRDQYAGDINMDAGGSFKLWDKILQGLNASFTDEVPTV